MDLSKIVVTVYDVFGYLLPGYIVLFALSLAESTFTSTWFLSLSLFSVHALPFAVAAYLSGQASHAVASLLTESKRCRTWIQAPRERLGAPLYATVRAEVDAAYGRSVKTTGAADTLEPYLLADAYVVAAGAGVERDLLTAREGFFKQAIVAFVALAVVLVLCLLAGGAVVQTRPGLLTPLGFWPTLTLTALTIGVCALFRLRFGFYHRIKMNNTMLLFLALRARERRLS